MNHDGDVKRYSEVHDDGHHTALCWIEIITLLEHSNGSRDVNKEYAILFESPGDFPEEYLDKKDEVIPYEIIDTDTNQSHVVNFTRVDVVNGDANVLENRKMTCASGPVYTKEFIEWPKSTKKRLEYKISPKKNDIIVVNPRRNEVEDEEPIKIKLTSDSVPDTSENKRVKIVNDEVYSSRSTSPDSTAKNMMKVESVTQQEIASEVMPQDKRKKKKKMVSESESTKRISMYRSLVHNELDNNRHNRQPTTTGKYILKTTVTNKPSSENSTSDDAIQSQASFSNSIITFPPHEAAATKQNFHSLCLKDKEHTLNLKINIVMEHKIMASDGETFVFPAMEMQKQVEFGVHPNSINKTERVTSLLINEKWEKFLMDLANGKRVNSGNKNLGSYTESFDNNGFSTTVTIDEATKYVTQLQNSLEACEKYIKENEKLELLKIKKVGNGAEKHYNKKDDFSKFPSDAHAINYYLKQPTVQELASNKKESIFRPENRSKIVTDVKRNLASEELIIEEMIDQQPSYTSNKVLPRKPLKHVRTFKRIVFHGDDPVVEKRDNSKENLVETATTTNQIIDTTKIVQIPEITTETKAVPIVIDNRPAASEGNFFVKVLGTLSSILRKLAA